MVKEHRLNLYLTISELAGMVTAVIGLLVLVGWAINLPFLKSVLPGFVEMKANAAICFVLTGVSLWSLQIKRIDKPPFRILGKLCASIAALVALLTLFEYAYGINFGIDQLFFVEARGAVLTAYPGRMAFVAAIGFFIAGIALLSLDVKTKRGYYPYQFLSVIAGFVALCSLYGYIYGLASFTGKLSVYTAMALNASIAFILLCGGLLLARPDKGSSSVITSSSSGGLMLRHLVPLIVIIPMISGWFRLQGERAGLYGSQFGMIIMVITNVVLLTAVIWWLAAVINRIEKERETAKIRLGAANEEWKMTFDSMTDFAFIIGMDNTIQNVNTATARLLAKDPKDIIGKKCYEIMHGLSYPLANCPMEKTRSDNKPHIEEVNDPHIGISLLVTTSPIIDSKGRITGVVHMAKDISSVKKSQEVLRDSETKYKTIFDSSNDAIMLLDPAGGFITGNAAALRMFGCKDKEEFTRQSPASLSSESQPDGQLSSAKAEKMMQIAMEKGSNFFEWTHRSTNGKEFSATVLLTRLELQGKPILQATVRDVTEKVLSERQLIKKLRDLEIFYKAAIDREMDIKSLKKKVQDLEAKIKE